MSWGFVRVLPVDEVIWKVYVYEYVLCAYVYVYADESFGHEEDVHLLVFGCKHVLIWSYVYK